MRCLRWKQSLSSLPQEALTLPGLSSPVQALSPGCSDSSGHRMSERRLQLWPPGGGRWPRSAGPPACGLGLGPPEACAGVAGAPKLLLASTGSLKAVGRAPDTRSQGGPSTATSPMPGPDQAPTPSTQLLLPGSPDAGGRRCHFHCGLFLRGMELAPCPLGRLPESPRHQPLYPGPPPGSGASPLPQRGYGVSSPFLARAREMQLPPQ